MAGARGEIVDAAFDSNIHGIAGDFTNDAALNRTIAVSTVAISEALQKVYGDTTLAAGFEPAVAALRRRAGGPGTQPNGR